MLQIKHSNSAQKLYASETKLFRHLYSIISDYLEEDKIKDVSRAYRISANAHFGQFRKSGEAYICHPLSVAIILAEMHMDAHGIIAAILHDVIEDTSLDKADLSEQFGNEVADLVEGVTKITKIDNKSHAETQAENVRKMLLAMAKDLRVIMLRLADRLHNMQTLDSMPIQTKRRIAKETQEIYVPLALRLSMNNVRHQLEILCLKAVHPLRYKIIEYAVKKTRGSRNEIVNTIKNAIKNRISQIGFVCKISGREKNVASIYKKMHNQKISFSRILDVYAFRICCNQVDVCYSILGCMHDLYKPIPGKFKDYIAIPKANGYQSLHTILVGPSGMPIEIQIRTHEMHNMAESGIAAHWLYKSNGSNKNNAQDIANEWLRSLLDIQKTAGNSLEFLDNLKVDLFPQEVFVFTPKGNIIKLPKLANIIDFAYAVHTDIGNTCISARIDNQLISLQTQLENGMTIEVITAPWAKPNPLWLNTVITVKARSSIRNYLKNFKQKEAINLGRNLLTKELKRLDLTLKHIEKSRIKQLLEVMQVQTLDNLLEEIGFGNKMPILVAKRLSQKDIYAAIKLEETSNNKLPLVIKGTEGMIVTLAKCCHPIPDDYIVGFFNLGTGIVIHHYKCRNINEVKKNHADLLDVEWSKEVDGEFSVELRIELHDQRGTLATIASIISNLKSNIENVSIINQGDTISINLMTISVKNRIHLANIMRQLKKLTFIIRITRNKS